MATTNEVFFPTSNTTVTTSGTATANSPYVTITTNGAGGGGGGGITYTGASQFIQAFDPAAELRKELETALAEIEDLKEQLANTQALVLDLRDFHK